MVDSIVKINKQIRLKKKKALVPQLYFAINYKLFITYLSLIKKNQIHTNHKASQLEDQASQPFNQRYQIKTFKKSW